MKRIFTLVFFISFYQFGIAQQKAEDALRKFQEAYPLEKIFLQYNKENYVAGEKVWFKSYVFSEYAFSNQATNLYVELYNQQKQLLDKSMLPLINGSGEGSFTLDQQLEEGVYYIRAYTSWMLNYDESFPYLHRFLVYNPQSARQVKPKPIQWGAKAFAESGHLLAGIENKVAVRLFSETFLPNSWKGVVKEKESPSKEVIQFTSFNEEVSSFQFVPEEGKSYIAEIRDNEGRIQTIGLPEVKSSGVVLKVQQQADTMVCTVLFKDLPAVNNQFKLLGHMQNHLIFKVNLSNQKPVVTVKVPVTSLRDGILHFTLFDSNEKPLAERLSFFHAEKITDAIVDLDILSFNERSRNTWQVKVDAATFHTYAMQVVEGELPATRESFLSGLLLSNDIKYKPSNAAWYFRAAHQQRKPALDALLITENWRWFNWLDILTDVYPKKEAREDAYLSYTGTVFVGKKLQLNKDINLLFQLRDSSIIFQQVRTDSSGSFQIQGAVFEDTAKVFYKINSKKGSADNVKLLFEQNNMYKRLLAPLPNSPYFLTTRKTNDSIPIALRRTLDAYKNQLIIDNRYKGLSEVIVTARRRSATARLNDSLSTGLFHRPNEIVFDFVNENQHASGNTNIIDWIKSRGYRGYTNARSVYIDEVSMPMNVAYTLPISDVAMVKMFRDISDYTGGGGGIAIYTRRGYMSYTKGLPQGYLVGYKRPDTYMSIDYADESFGQINHDVREVLYWNTSFRPQNEKAVVSFYNNDVAKSYRVMVMGFTKDGHPVYVERIVSKDAIQ